MGEQKNLDYSGATLPAPSYTRTHTTPLQEEHTIRDCRQPQTPTTATRTTCTAESYCRCLMFEVWSSMCVCRIHTCRVSEDPARKCRVRTACPPAPGFLEPCHHFDRNAGMGKMCEVQQGLLSMRVVLCFTNCEDVCSSSASHFFLVLLPLLHGSLRVRETGGSTHKFTAVFPMHGLNSVLRSRCKAEETLRLVYHIICLFRRGLAMTGNAVSHMLS